MEPIERFRMMLDAECGLSRLTISTYLRDVRGFSAFCGADGANPEKIAAYFQGIAHSNATIKRIATPIRQFLTFLGRPDLALLVPSVRCVVPSPKPITTDQCHNLRRAMVRHDPTYAVTAIRSAAIFEVLYGCGLRVSELCGLTLRAFDISYRKLRVWGKGNRERLIALNDTPYEALSRYVREWRPRYATPSVDRLFISTNGTSLSRTDVSRMIHQRAWAEDVGRASAHTLRHSYATHRMERNDPLEDIQHAMGHSSLSVTQRYLAVSPGRMRQVMQQCHPSFQVEVEPDKE